MDRRTLLGTAGALGAGVALTARAPASARELTAADHPAPAGGAGPDRAAFDLAPARAALLRLLTERQAAGFELVALDGPERFEVTGVDGVVRVGGPARRWC